MLYVQPAHVARFELETYTMLRDLVRDDKVPCGWKTLDGVHALASTVEVDLAAERLEQLRTHHPDLAAHLRLVTDRPGLDALRLGERIQGAVVQDVAAMCWPYKLVSWLLTNLLREECFNLQTGTSALRLDAAPAATADAGLWMVHTDRGAITAKDVVLATNAYTSFLLHSFAGLITPVRGQVAALVSPAPQLEQSHLWTTREPGDPAESEDYLVHRETGELILGGGAQHDARRRLGYIRRRCS